MSFRITGLPPQPFQHLFGLSDEELARHRAQRYVADTKPGYPDRIEVRDAEPGETLILALDEARAAARHGAGVAIVLVRRNAETSDIAALELATGLLTQRGARTSHVAVVARQLGKVCLVGCADLQIDEVARTLKVGDSTLHEGDLLALDGNESTLYAGAARTEIECPVELLAQLRPHIVGRR